MKWSTVKWINRLALNWERAVSLWLALARPHCNPLCDKEKCYAPSAER